MSITTLPVSRTKVIVPILRPEILHRSRVMALFSDLLDKKLILITAPAGYGKTTLMVDFAKSAEMPICWLSLDALDKDPQRFITYLIAAIAERFPGFGRQSDADLKSVTNLGQDSEGLLYTLTNEIYNQVDEHFALVIDDYHLVDPVPAIRDFLSRFIYLAGENCHVILASRRLPSLPDIALMVARQQVGGFDLEQLAFRREEIQSLLEKNQGIKPTDQLVEELMRRTEGWITGLLLSVSGAERNVPALLGKMSRTNLHQAARSAGVDLTVYFNQQILAPQPAELREFLLQTSLLEEFDADLCNAVLGVGRWKNLIETIRRNNLFILQVGAEGKWLRYHPLFREFLQERIQHEEPDVARAILGRLAEVYEESGEWEKAHAVYRQFANAGLLAGLVQRAGTPMLMSERLVTLADWLSELPASLLQERPSLLALKGALLCAQGNGRSALKLLDEAIPGLQKTNKVSDLVLAFVRRAAAYRLVGDHARSLQDADEALLLSENKAEMQTTYAEAELFKGISLSNLGRMAEAIQTHEDALRRYEQLGEPQNMARVQMCLGDAYRSTDNYPAARNAYEQALSEWRKESNLPWQASTLNNLGVLYHLQGEYEQAVRSFEAGLECTRGSNSTWREALLLTSLGDVYIDLDEFESAEQAYTNAIIISKKISYQFLTNYLSLAQARLARLRGQLKDANSLLERAEAPIQAIGSYSERGRFHLERGCLRQMEKKPTAARAELGLALDLFQQGSLTMETDSCHIWLAATALAGEDHSSARSHLHAALKSVPAEGDFSPILQDLRRALPWLSNLRDDMEIGPLLAPWLKRATREEKRLPGLRKRLRRLLTSVPIQAPRLTIKAFGKAQVWVNGKLVPSSQWKTGSVRGLFFFFLSRRRPVTKGEIGEILWPERSTEQLKLRFKNDLYRLRHALGQDTILFENDQYSFNRLLDFDYDVENFESHLAKARTAVTDEEKMVHLRAASKLRQAPYINDVDATWALPERERLEQACLAALKQLAELHYRSGDLPSALQACQDALKIDSCREDIHRLAMQLHAGKGDRLAVIWQYQACREALRTELDMPVSEETEALYQRLTV